MKKTFKIITFALFILLALGVTTSTVMAQEVNSEPDTVEVKVLPDSPLYFFKILAERIRETFTFRTEAKLELMERLGEKRVLEAQRLIEKGKSELAEKHLEKYNQRLEKMEKLFEKKGDRIKTRLDKVGERIENRFKKRLQALDKVLEKVPEKARPGLKRALEKSEKQLESLKSKIQERIKRREELNQRLRDRLDNLNDIDDGDDD